ncbi:hypothetical protein [Streptomyces longispororuber]|uniref:hypothetical protein n=1 Tax=Streptomyces longispororuber TaxID=68230 RepID=UPI00210DB465|nr:hypothetical protein [Streptomyces longispororuber]MCQ4212698.1 hypothetical protein [Streptomyces longispororuber]
MHGHGYAPPPPRLPSPGAQAGLRVLFVAIAVLTVGFLGFVPMLRLALTTRSKVDWRVFGAVAGVQLVCWVGVFSDPGGEEFTTWWGNAAMGLMLVNLAVSVTYYLVADIRHGRRQQFAARPGLLYGMPQPQPSYGYPQPQPQPQAYPQTPPPPMHAMPTQTAGPAPLPPQNQHPSQPQNPHPSQTQGQTPGQTQGQPPHRIDQVRAELDELSDYLRKQDGGR